MLHKSIVMKRIIFLVIVLFLVDSAKLGLIIAQLQIFKVKTGLHKLNSQIFKTLIYNIIQSDESILDSSLSDDASQGPAIGIERVSDGGFSVM